MRAALVFVLLRDDLNVPIVCEHSSSQHLRKGQWVIGTGLRGSWMTFSALHISSVMELVLTVWGQSVGGELRLQLGFVLCAHVWVSTLHHQVSFVRLLSLSGCLTRDPSFLSVSQSQNCFLRRCCCATTSTGGNTRLLHWSWTASWAERRLGWLMHTQIKLET